LERPFKCQPHTSAFPPNFSIRIDASGSDSSSCMLQRAKAPNFINKNMVQPYG
jgi:hypothetical protein